MLGPLGAGSRTSWRPDLFETLGSEGAAPANPTRPEDRDVEAVSPSGNVPVHHVRPQGELSGLPPTVLRD